MALNLMENAVRHTPAGTHVHASVSNGDGTVRLVVSDDGPGFGEEFKKGFRDPVISVGLAGFGEALPRFENFVEIDPSGQLDAYGIPVLRIQMTWGDNERAMVADMAESGAEMMDAAGAKNIGSANWLLLFPAVFLVSTLFALNFVGDGLRDALDPRDR